jgi:hypothetical protein
VHYGRGRVIKETGQRGRRVGDDPLADGRVKRERAAAMAEHGIPFALQRLVVFDLRLEVGREFSIACRESPLRFILAAPGRARAP